MDTVIKYVLAPAVILVTFLFFTLGPGHSQQLEQTPACAEYAVVITPEVIAAVKEAEGEIVEIKAGPALDAFIQRGTDIFHQDPPYAIGSVALVRPTKDALVWNVAFFNEGGCYLGKVRWTNEVVNIMLARTPA